MPDNVVNQAALAGSVPHDLSVVTLFLQADTLVKCVMLLLLILIQNVVGNRRNRKEMAP